MKIIKNKKRIIKIIIIIIIIIISLKGTRECLNEDVKFNGD